MIKTWSTKGYIFKNSFFSLFSFLKIEFIFQREIYINEQGLVNKYVSLTEAAAEIYDVKRAKPDIESYRKKNVKDFLKAFWSNFTCVFCVRF